MIILPVSLLISKFVKTSEFVFCSIIRVCSTMFFGLVNLFVPNVKTVKHDYKELKKVRSSIIISNHISFLDGLLIVAAFKKTAGVVKSKYIKIPVMGFIMDKAGFIPSFYEDEKTAGKAFKRLLELNKRFETGGNLFMFPEGTRGESNKLNKFYLGAFKLAIKYNVPIEVIQVKNTEKLMKGLLINTDSNLDISIERLGRIFPSEGAKAKDLRKQALELYNQAGLK